MEELTRAIQINSGMGTDLPGVPGNISLPVGLIVGGIGFPGGGISAGQDEKAS